MRSASVSADASIRVLALDGIPEIREGDDLGHFIGNAIQRTAGALPLTPQGRSVAYGQEPSSR